MTVHRRVPATDSKIFGKFGVIRPEVGQNAQKVGISVFSVLGERLSGWSDSRRLPMVEEEEYCSQ